MSLSSTASIALISMPVPGERAMAPVTVMSPKPSEHLIRRLASALESRAIAYCQWKGVWRPGSDGDIDLLVDSRAALSFRSLVQELGFRAVLPSGERQLPG